jgi:acetyl-CoA acetyltransferase family protein
MTTPEVVIVNAVRTPFGKYFGGLSGTRPDDLLGQTLRELAVRTPALDLNLLDDVIIGDANGAGEDNRNVARMGLLLAGFPETIPGVTINRLCGSGADAFIQASRAIRAGDLQYVIAGGVEIMSRAPWIVERSGKEKPTDPEYHQSTIGWRMTNPVFPEHWTFTLGRCSEIVAENLKISREAQDEWAFRSHQLASAAWDRGIHTDWVMSVGGVTRDESIRADTTLEKLAQLPSAFSEGGAGTAGNSSPINDGSVAALITSKATAIAMGLEPIGTILGARVVATSPDLFTLAPVPAIRQLLAKLDLSTDQIKVWEINEAFASMVLTVLHEMPEIPAQKVNINGGSIAMGHPVGASAARVVVDTARELRRQGGGIGIAAACIGVGLGIALAIKVEA